jgi:hypothetical protein
MNRQLQFEQFKTRIFSLSDEGVEFRNKWRGRLQFAVWFILSFFCMVIMILGSGTKDPLKIGIIFGMSLVKYIPLLMVVYSLARIMAARYLDDVYELHDEELASDFLEEVTFGHGHERVTINEGRISARDEESPLIRIGGPGSIQVNLGNVALLEKVNGEPQVIYPRNESWGLGRFERIREIGKNDKPGKREYAIINLRDQFVGGLSVKSRTKDGIPIEVQGIKVMFSILRKQQTKSDKVEGDAYQFDENAVRAIVYNQTIITPRPSAPSGITFPWDTTVIPLVISELEDLIMSHNLGEILASISQKELDTAFSNDQTEAQMRLEMTGQQVKVGARREAPKFESRSKITAQFFEKEFKEKAAKLGVSVEWIDIGTWQLPSSLILEKHKEAWNLSRENAKKRSTLERTKKKHEMEEILKLVDNVIVKNFEKKAELRKLPDDELKKMIDTDPKAAAEYQQQLRQYQQQGSQKKNPRLVAQEMLNAFRVELRAAKSLIENDIKPLEETATDLANIEKALLNISHFTPTHWVNKP